MEGFRANSSTAMLKHTNGLGLGYYLSLAVELFYFNSCCIQACQNTHKEKGELK